VNAACPAIVKGAILHYSRRYAMDIDNLGEALVDQLVDTGRVHDVADLYDLNLEELSALDRMGQKSAQNVLDSIEASRNQPFARLLTGLGIEHVGQVAARQLAELLGSLEQFLSCSPEDLRERATNISGFGPVMVESVVAFANDATQRALLKKLLHHNVSRAQPRAIVATSGPLAGLNVCVTGVLSRKREDVHADIRAAGGTIDETVKKDTHYLVAGEKVGKSKLARAKKFGTRVIDEAKLGDLLNGKP
jgi:DNA ligase (NAD+)